MGVWRAVVVIALLGEVATAHAEDGRAASEATSASAGHDRFQPELNLRLRSELETFADRATRLRWRVRARMGASYRLEHGVAVGVRLATGSEDPTSAQLTLGGTFDKAPLRLDRAYFRYHPAPWLDLWAGKVPIAFENRRLIWDRDLQPEGFSEIVVHELPRFGLSLHLALGQYILDELSSTTRDPAVLVAQIGAAGRHGHARWALHGAHYRYVNTTDSALGYDHGANSRTSDGLLVYDYHIVDLLAEASATVTSIEMTGYAELARNLAVDGGSTALAVGLDLEATTLRARAGYEYRRVGRDAILDNLAESSWYGPQATDFQGHKVWLSHELSPELELATSGKLMHALGGPANRQLEWLVDVKWEL